MLSELQGAKVQNFLYFCKRKVGNEQDCMTDLSGITIY